MPAWFDELDLHAGPPEAAMGTRALEPSRWLCIDDDWVSQRDESRRMLRDQRDEVLASGVDDAAIEVGERIDTWLATYRPALADGAHLLEPDPLAAAAARVAEDLCILVPGPEGWVLAAGAVCFPSYWRLHEKIGRPLGEVHAPVPGYAGLLANRVDTFLGRLRSGQGVWRRNWSIHHSPDLFAPVHRPPAGPPPPPEARWLRTEHQTLLRLHDTESVVFTIRTQQAALGRLAARPDRCAALAAAVRGWTPAQRAYKGGAVDEALLRWLEDHADPG